MSLSLEKAFVLSLKEPWLKHSTHGYKERLFCCQKGSYLPSFWTILTFEIDQMVYTSVSTLKCVISTPPPGLLSVFVVVRNGFFYKHYTRFVYLMQMIYLLFAISLRLQAVAERASAWTTNGNTVKTKADALPCLGVTTMYWQLFDFTCCPRNPWITARGRGGGGGGKLAYIKTPWISFFFPERLPY